MSNAQPNRRRWPLFAAAVFAALAWPGAGLGDEPYRHPPDFTRPPVVVDVDALGLIEQWWRHQPGPTRRSSAVLLGPATTLLFGCLPADALYVWIDGPAAPGDVADGFGCAAGEGLFAVSGGGLVCRRHAVGPYPLPASAAAIAIGDRTSSHVLVGECIGPTGSKVPAYVPPDLVSAGGDATPPCPSGRSSVRFRGRLMAGGC